MDGSTSSSLSKGSSPGSRDSSSSCQESRWTDYFDYFMESEKGKATSYCSSWDGSDAAEGFSLVSDAASAVLAAGWKPSKTGRVDIPKGCRKLKWRHRTLEDDALEDTASSPVSSPKVGDLIDVNTREKDDSRYLSQGNKIASRNRFEMKGLDLNEMDFVARVNECEELKKKGLCVVPMSMLVDYLNN
ncbi:hypothetical protein Taro_039917 [Colocasia esculenta]|uniref:Uncharacterized protein n=1 Tax=Colocasia esculenta TaxID=4460 RepID=A0A843WNN1_COLES|nr:hypothetical protein [Colocasia esculenta]